MKYKELENTDTGYIWYIVDTEYHEFAECDRCRAAVPIKIFHLMVNVKTSREERLCRLCANSVRSSADTRRDAIYAANMVLLTLGAFDEIEIEKWGT